MNNQNTATSQLCCATPMSVVPARPQDHPYEHLLLCADCGHHEPLEVCDDDRCHDCGTPVLGDAQDFTYDRLLCTTCLTRMNARWL